MICQKLETVAMEYLDGALSATQYAEVKHHLAACPACHARLEGFRSVSLALEAWEAPEVSPWFNAQLHRRIAELEAAAWNWRDAFRALLRPSYVAALGVVLVIGSVAVWNAAPLRKPAPAGQTAPVAAAQPASVDEALRVAEDYDILTNFEVLVDLRKDAGGTL